MKLEEWLSQTIVLGFNSASYDLNVVKRHLIRLLMTKKSKRTHCLKASSWVKKKKSQIRKTTCPSPTRKKKKRWPKRARRASSKETTC